MLGLLLIYFSAAIALVPAASAPVVPTRPSPPIYKNKAFNHSVVSSLGPSSLNNSTTISFDPPPTPWIRQTSAGSTIILSDYGSARVLDPYPWEADIENVLARAEAEDARRVPSSLVPRMLDYNEEHAFLYVRLLLPEMTWSIWSAALEQILYFNRNWSDVTFYFRIIQPSGPGPGSVNRVVATGQLRVR